jgi:AmmeMemoRadiSam system protein A
VANGAKPGHDRTVEPGDRRDGAGGEGPEPLGRPTQLGRVTQEWLLTAARDALGRAMGLAMAELEDAPENPRLLQPTRVFVSWHQGQRLVGCIGTLEADRSLADAVPYFAVQAGLHDRRTPMPTAADLPRLECEISVLSPSEPMAERGLAGITAALVPGRDGLVLYEGARRAVFLPVVWESLPTAAGFVAALCRKAGIDGRARGEHVRGERFFAQKFAE